jgi:RimJ/RimL family protein N-acetyltransferase
MPGHLRPFRQSDLDTFTTFWCLPEVAQFMPDRVITPDAAKHALIERVFSWELTKPGDCRWYAITEHGAFIGEVMLHWRPSGRGEIAYALDPEYRGRGIATSAALDMLRIGFDQLRLQRIYGACMPLNDRSAHLLQRLGMHPEGQPSAPPLEADWCDLHVYSMSNEDWAVKAA